MLYRATMSLYMNTFLSLYSSLCVSLSLYLSLNLLTRCQDHIPTENIWFVWSVISYSTIALGEKWGCYQCEINDKQQTREMELLSLWTVESLSFAISRFIKIVKLSKDPKLAKPFFRGCGSDQYIGAIIHNHSPFF